MCISQAETSLKEEKEKAHYLIFRHITTKATLKISFIFKTEQTLSFSTPGS